MQTCIWPSRCHCHSLSLASVKSRLVLPFWYRLTMGSPGQSAVKRVCVRVLSGGSMKLNVLRLTHAIPSQGCDRYAVASLGDKVFVAGQGRLEVYNATTFDLQHNHTLHRLGEHCYGLAACSSSNCLYASDWQNSRIYTE